MCFWLKGFFESFYVKWEGCSVNTAKGLRISVGMLVKHKISFVSVSLYIILMNDRVPVFVHVHSHAFEFPFSFSFEHGLLQNGLLMGTFWPGSGKELNGGCCWYSQWWCTFSRSSFNCLPCFLTGNLCAFYPVSF